MTSDLIIGFLKGSLNEKEINQFYDWVNETPENKQIFFEAKMVYDACLSKGSNIDMDKSWQRLLEKKQKQAPRKIYTLFQKVQAYAAVAVIAVAFTSVLFWWLGDASSVPVARYVGGDGIVADKVVLPDGTEISMGSQTNFRYDPQYGKEKRVVYLEGEAFFNVAKQKDKPFIVVVNGQEIEALGTKFNVDAYPSDSVVTTTLLEGSIRLVSEKVNTSTVLTPNQQYIYHKNKGSYKVAQVDAALYTSWISGYYYFHEENLEGILARLGNIYGVSFRIQSDKLKERRFTGTFYRGQNIARLKAAKAQEESAKLSFQQALLNAGSEVSNALSLYQKTSEKVESRRLQVESAKKASEDTKELFNLGTSTYLEVLSAQQSYLSAQISQVSDCFDRMQAVVSLYQALGGGREE